MGAKKHFLIADNGSEKIVLQGESNDPGIGYWLVKSPSKGIWIFTIEESDKVGTTQKFRRPTNKEWFQIINDVTPFEFSEPSEAVKLEDWKPISKAPDS